MKLENGCQQLEVLDAKSFANGIRSHFRVNAFESSSSIAVFLSCKRFIARIQKKYLKGEKHASPSWNYRLLALNIRTKKYVKCRIKNKLVMT